MAVEVYLKVIPDQYEGLDQYRWRLFTLLLGRETVVNQSWNAYATREQARDAGEQYCKIFGLRPCWVVYP